MKDGKRTAQGRRVKPTSPAAPHVLPQPDGSLAMRWLVWIIALFAVVIPLVMSSSGQDSFRYPKELVLRLEVILLAVVLVSFWAFGQLRLAFGIRAKWLALTGMICAWTILTALFSTQRLVSLPPTIRVLEYALLFTVSVLAFRGQPLWIAGVIVPSAVVNAIVYIAQEFELWAPFDTSGALEKHLGRTALIGNPNDVGSYLVVPALIAVTLAFAPRRGRWAWTAAAIVLIAATFITQTLAAIAALVVALIVLVGLRLRSWTKALLAVIVLLVAASGIAMVYAPLRQRVSGMRDAMAKRDYEALSAARLLPFFAAAEMAKDRPLLGVGPGCFAYNFFEYKLRVQTRHRWLFGPGVTGYNFGEVHNDHLQVVSETGLPGYALFLAALTMIAAGSFSRPETGLEGAEESARAEFVRLLALPLAVSLFVLALAQFPLELVAPTHVYLWAAGIVTSWSRP